VFVQLLLPELLWEGKFCTIGEPHVSPEHLKRPSVSPFALIQAASSSCCRKRGRLLLQTAERRLSLPPLSVLFRFTRLASSWRNVHANPFVGPASRAAGLDAIWRQPASAWQRDGWCHRWRDDDTCLSFYAPLPQPQHIH